MHMNNVQWMNFTGFHFSYSPTTEFMHGNIPTSDFQWKLCYTIFFLIYLCISKVDIYFFAAKKNDYVNVGCKAWRNFTVSLAVDFVAVVLPILLIFTVSVLDVKFWGTKSSFPAILYAGAVTWHHIICDSFWGFTLVTQSGHEQLHLLMPGSSRMGSWMCNLPYAALAAYHFS